LASRIGGFLKELKRRKVYHVGVTYVVVAAGTIGLAEAALGDTWEGTLRIPVVVAFLLGFPIALVLAWAYEVRPEETTGSMARRESSESYDKARKSIVVLPFDNLSPDPADVYFSGGLTEELTATLSHFRSLRVISRSSAAAYKEAFKDVRTIAEDLGVQYVLEGSVRKAGDDLRITAQLIDARTDEHLWAKNFDGTLEDVFGMQEKVSRSIADSLEIHLGPGEEESLSARPITDPQAYNTYLLAMYEFKKLTEEGLTRALNLIEEALSRVGENAFLYSVKAECLVLAYDFGLRRDDEVLCEVETLTTRALALDPDLGLAHYGVGYAKYKRGDLQGFVSAAKRSLELEQNTDAAALLAFVLAEVGKADEAREYAEAAVERDPLSFFAFWGMGCLEIFLGRPEEALSMVEGAMGMVMTEEVFALWWLAQALGYAGDEERARSAFEKVSNMGAGFLSDLGELHARALADDEEGLRTALGRRGVREVASTDEYFPLYIANSLARIGEYEEALQWLEQAIDWGFTNHEFLSKHNRYLEPLRGDPVFERLMDTAREKQEAFEV
jgi:serine/threonine-protein kinase